jgi:hypothetical protein
MCPSICTYAHVWEHRFCVCSNYILVVSYTQHHRYHSCWHTSRGRKAQYQARNLTIEPESPIDRQSFLERRGEWRPRRWTLGVKNSYPFFSPYSPFVSRKRSRILGWLSFVISLVRFISSWYRPGRRAKGACKVPSADRSRLGSNSGREPDGLYIAMV